MAVSVHHTNANNIKGKIETVKILLSAGAKLDLKDYVSKRHLESRQKAYSWVFNLL